MMMKSGMTFGDVVFLLRNYARIFVREYENPKVDQKVIDAIVVDFVNFFAYHYCAMDLKFHTKDLRNDKQMNEKILADVDLDYDIIDSALDTCRKIYSESGIIESVNTCSFTNECGRNAEADDRDACKVVEDFVTSCSEFCQAQD